MNCPICGTAYAAPITLATEALTVASRTLTYRLLLLTRPKRVFAVQIEELGKEAETQVVGADLTTALAIYLKLVKGSVSICHLADVVRDITYSI